MILSQQDLNDAAEASIQIGDDMLEVFAASLAPVMLNRPLPVITKEQRKSLKQLYDRALVYTADGSRPITYREFRKTAFVAFGDCIMVPWCGMVVGIEADGYAHT